MEFSAGTLEFEALRELLARSVGSALGREYLERCGPRADRASLEAELAEVAEALEYLRSAGGTQTAGRGAAVRLNFGGIADVRPSAHKLRIEGATLEPREIFELIALLDRAAGAKTVLRGREQFPLLSKRAEGIGEFRGLLRDLEGKILPDGSVADTASVALNRLRRDIERQKRQIQESLERFLRVHKDEGILQEEIVTIRNERYVVPVISGQRRKMNGVIHAASSSGQTLFVEPLETIDLNNELVRLTEEEMREVHRILRELSEKLRANAAPIAAAVAIMGQLDWLFARANFARDFNCTIPRFAGRRLHLKDARHPLLEDVLRKQSRRPVPVSLTLDASCRTLLISGPNTGGKTVTLKTVGLIALMAQSALPVPCAEAELPVFEQVLADIGDKQSIAESLSTFSSHMSHIREMALDVTPDSLVLLDEIGSATDPEEGGALGVALVEHFRAAGAFTLASTHLTALKVYGSRTETVLNASMGFDESTLEPTYLLRLGLPGKSAGLDIAQRLGMPEDIMKRARASLSSHETEFSKLLGELHARLEAAERTREELRRLRDELAVREKRMRSELLKTERDKVEELEERFQAFLARYESDASKALEHVIENSEKRKAAEEAQREVNRMRREIQDSFLAVKTPPVAAAAGKPGAAKKLVIEEGARVRIRGVRDVARVRRRLSDEQIEVEAGFMKMRVPVSDIEEVLPAAGQPAAAAKALPTNVSFQQGPEFAPVTQELNVIGERADEACDQVERFLDNAVLATASRVRIVHGHGMGILKRAIGDLLKRSPHVEKFYAATQAEGGTGATIVELRA